MTLLDDADELWVAKGRKVLRFDLETERPTDDELRGLILGRSGKLRAPSIRVGNRLLVGYNAELLERGLA